MSNEKSKQKEVGTKQSASSQHRLGGDKAKTSGEVRFTIKVTKALSNLVRKLPLKVGDLG